MIYPDYKLIAWAQDGGLNPFEPACINPASVDLRWSGRYREAHIHGWSDVIDTFSLTLRPGRFYLLDSLETIAMPVNAAGLLLLKSSMARRGLQHLFAGFFDPGFIGTATWEFVNVAPWDIEVKRGQRLMQLALMETDGTPDLLYAARSGHYQGQAVPTVAVAA